MIPRTSSTTAPLYIPLPIIRARGAAIHWSATPRLLSSATQSVAGSVGSANFGPIALSPSTPGCATVKGGLQCTIVVSAPVGTNESVQVRSYASSAITRDPLASGGTTANVFANQNNYLSPLGFNGLAYHLGVELQDGRLQFGRWARSPLVAYGIDAAHEVIPSVSVLSHAGSPISVQVQATGFQAKRFQIESGYICCGPIPAGYSEQYKGPLNFVYNGRGTGSETFSIAASGFTTNRKQTVTVAAGNTDPATIIAPSFPFIDSYGYEYNTYTAAMNQFASDANGNVAPLRSMLYSNAFGSMLCVCEDSTGDYWVGDTQYSNAGEPLGSISISGRFMAIDSHGNYYAQSPSCSMLEYSAGFGTRPAIRQINNCPWAIAVDAPGNVYMAIENGPDILEFSPSSGSGNVSPSRVMTQGSGSNFLVVDVDAAGNVYGLLQTSDPTAPLQLWEFAPGATTGTHLLQGVPLSGFAVDDAGDIYAAVTGASLNAVEEFAPGSSTPERIINGSLTQNAYINGNVYVMSVPRTR